jgi:hypothetical protein
MASWLCPIATLRLGLLADHEPSVLNAELTDEDALLADLQTIERGRIAMLSEQRAEDDYVLSRRITWCICCSDHNVVRGTVPVAPDRAIYGV